MKIRLAIIKPFHRAGCYKDNISSFKVLSKSGMVLYRVRENGDPHFFIDVDIYEKIKSLKKSVEVKDA